MVVVMEVGFIVQMSASWSVDLQLARLRPILYVSFWQCSCKKQHPHRQCLEKEHDLFLTDLTVNNFEATLPGILPHLRAGRKSAFVSQLHVFAFSLVWFPVEIFLYRSYSTSCLDFSDARPDLKARPEGKNRAILLRAG